MALAEHIAGWSKDRSTKVGCVIVGPHREIRALGYNGFPRGADDTVECRHERPLKYRWTEHAERNAVYNATLTGTSLEGCTAYVTVYPCTDCARALIQSGVRDVFVGSWCIDSGPQWDADFKVSGEMLAECNVRVRSL